MMHLVLPKQIHKQAYEKLKKEWSSMEDITTISPGSLFFGNSFEEFLEHTQKYRSNSPTGVNSSLYFLIAKNEIFGSLEIRHNINHPNLYEAGGHIGYGIAPKHRRKGYGSKMLELGLQEAKKLGITKILITCDLNNIGSAKVIQNNGGVFERKTKDGEKKRYLIDIDSL